MSAITAALLQIDGVAAERELAPEPSIPLKLETAGEAILLPDGKGSTRRCCTANRSTSSRSRCSTWTTRHSRAFCA
jgi:hypothetical protein